MSLTRKLLVALSFFALHSSFSSASHLMGGSLSYQFLYHDSSVNQNHYRVKLQLFRDCTSGTPLANPIDLGVYDDGPTVILNTTYSLVQDSLKFIVPPSPGDSCNFTTSVCVQEGDYHVDITLGASVSGFHLLAQLYARNAAILNLDNPGGLGQTYYAFIPPSLINNSSPTFADIPVPFICTIDTVSIVNLATDADGDSLSYSFVVPYDSYAHPPVALPGVISIPPPIVPYNVPTYSFAQPFGPGGYSNIDPVTGLTQYYIPNIGNYVVCVQIDEYRNGVFIASTRRDLQLIAITCPPNPSPVLSTSGGSGTTTYNITEGQTLCFPVTMSDPNGDSIYVHAAGTLFDSTIVYPNATLPDIAGKPSATGQFCWTTACGQGRSAPYQFTVSATDDGCPPKVANVVYTIYVHPFAGPTTINGPDSVCNLQAGVAYNVTNAAGNTYHWSVTNGTQTTGGTTANATIDWANAASGSISLYAVSQYGCTRDTISKSVVLKPLPVPDAGTDKSFCSGQSVSIGAAPVSGYTYSWNPAGGLDSVTSSIPNVTLTNGSTAPVTHQYILTATLNGCPNNDTTIVTVRPLPISPAIADRFACSGDTVHLGSALTSGYTYSWSPSSGLDSITASNPAMVVINGTSVNDTLMYYISTTLSGCVTGDTVTIILRPLPSVTATANPDSICLGDTATLQASGASTYSWANSLTPGTSIGTGSIILVNPTVSTTYIVTGTAATGCRNTYSVSLYESPLPPVLATASPDSVCDGASATLSASGAVSYWWAFLSVPTVSVSTAPSINFVPDSSVSYILTGINALGCVNKDTVRVTIVPVPLVDSIYGNQSLCPGVSGVGYIALPFTSTSAYQWFIQSGNITTGQGTDTIFADWDTLSGPGSIRVVETTNFGCVSDTVTLPVNINVILTPAAPFGITPICEENSDSCVYSTFNTPGSVYTWGAYNGSIISANGTSQITVDWDTTGNGIGIIWYQENSTTLDTACYGISDTLFVTIHPRPVTSSILGSYAVCAFDTASVYLVNPTSGSYYLWNATGGAITSGDSTNVIHINWGQAGNDTITVIETNVFGCSGLPVDTTILLHPLPAANAGSDVPVCTGDSVQLNAYGGVSYLWSPSTNLSNAAIFNPWASPASTAQYIVLVTDANNCKNTDTMQVNVNALPTIDAGNNANMCYSYGSQLNATAGGSAYLWTPVIGLNDSTIHNPFANPATTTVYYVTLTDINNCHNTDSVKITVLSLPVADAGPDTTICDGVAINLNGSGGVGYSWYPAIGINNIHIANPVASPSDSITYTLTVTGANTCQSTDQVFVDVKTTPQALFAVEFEPTCSGLLAKLVNSSVDQVSYVWYFGDGTSLADSNQNPLYVTEHLYAYGNTGILSLVSINNTCTDTMYFDKPDIGISSALDSLPNVFTPNGDGLNDCFQITPTGGLNDCATITIFNRWGETVFEGSTAHRCWDGKNKNGNACAAGVYFFVVKVGNGTKNGSVQLIRD